MAETKRVERPMSPHLQIYALSWTMVMSIVHRITGTALYLGTLLLAWWLIAAATGPQAFETASWFMNSWVGRLVLLGYTWALFHHMLGGLRHFVWDAGYGFGMPQRELMAKATLAGSVALTILVWIIAFATR